MPGVLQWGVLWRGVVYSNMKKIMQRVLVFSSLLIILMMGILPVVLPGVDAAGSFSLAAAPEPQAALTNPEGGSLCLRGHFAGGSGTAHDPFLVATAHHLHNVRLFPEAHFKQIAGIDLDVHPWNQGAGWVPIGGNDDPFGGSYDGNGNLITNLFIHRPSTNMVGLFGHTSAATIKNLMIKDAVVNGNRFVGGLVGDATNESHIEHVYIENIMLTVNHRHGGGLLGRAMESTVFRCYSTGSLQRGELWDWNSIGGLIGSLDSPIPDGRLTTLEESFSTVNVTSGAHNGYGGLVGSAWVHILIKNCYSIGSVQGKGHWAAGILAELQAGSLPKTIKHSYAATYVNAPGGGVSGFMGYQTGGLYQDNFFDVEVSGQSWNDPAATGKSTAEMKIRQTYTNAGWDFNEVWAHDETHEINNGYPFLQWQLDVCLPPVSVAFTSITASTASLEWQQGIAETEWKMRWGTTGFNPDNEGTPATDIVNTGFTLTGLDHGTAYDIYIRSICREYSESNWTGPFTFATVSRFHMDGGGHYCEGTEPTGVDIRLDGSDAGFAYQLYKNDTPHGVSKAGTGGVLTWHNADAGTYTVYAHSGIAGDWMSGEISVVEQALPEVHLALGLDNLCIDGPPVALSGGEPESGYYTGPGVSNDMFDPEAAGEGVHDIYYTYEDGNGCAGSATEVIIVNDCLGAEGPPADAWVKLYPNPARGTLYYEPVNDSVELIRVQIIDFRGKLVSGHLPEGSKQKYSIDIRGLPPGGYVARFVFAEGRVSVPFVVW
ncbi:MAG: hypothetical protein EA394_09665 [Bacteroidia bacterium]|nr:MAG: hypothetical protein EA394_09665 [Bacteroidia bacterium]